MAVNSSALSDAIGSRVLYENEFVRVWDQTVHPGEEMAEHIHRLDYSFAILQTAWLRFYDPDSPSDFSEAEHTAGRVGFHAIAPGEPKVDRRLRNVGTTTFRAIASEFKREAPTNQARRTGLPLASEVRQAGAATPPSTAMGTRMLFENARIRVWDLALAPGETCEKHMHELDYYFVVERGGLIRFANPDRASDYRDVQFVDDQVTFREIGPGEGKVDNRLINIGPTPHRNIVVELKR